MEITTNKFYISKNSARRGHFSPEEVAQVFLKESDLFQSLEVVNEEFLKMTLTENGVRAYKTLNEQFGSFDNNWKELDS